MMAAIERDFGPISILINNAGIASRGKAVADTEAAEVEKLLAVLAVGAHRLSRLALPQLRRLARSDIVFISSIATLHNASNGAPYNVAKAAGEALALTLAKEEMKNGVRVNIVAPSLTVSDMDFTVFFTRPISLAAFLVTAMLLWLWLVPRKQTQGGKNPAG